MTRAHLLGLSGSLLESRDVQDTVGVDVKGDLDLRNTSRSGGDTRKVELSEQVAVLGPGTLSLEDLDCGVEAIKASVAVPTVTTIDMNSLKTPGWLSA